MKVKDLLKVLNELPIKDLEADIEIFARGESYTIDYVEMMQKDALHSSEYLSVGCKYLNIGSK